MMDLHVLGSRIKQLRTNAGMTQREMAKAVGVTATSMSAYENGTQNPSISIVAKIAEMFDVKIDWLCGNTENYRQFKPDRYCSVNLPNALEALSALLEHRDIIEANITKDEDSFEIAELVINSHFLELFIIEQTKIRDLLESGTIGIDMYMAVHDSLIYKSATKIYNEIKEMNA